MKIVFERKRDMTKNIAIKDLLDDEVQLLTSSELHKFTKTHARKSKITRKRLNRSILPATVVKNGVTKFKER